MKDDEINIVFKYDKNGVLHGYNAETGEEIGVVHETGDEFIGKENNVERKM